MITQRPLSLLQIRNPKFAIRNFVLLLALCALPFTSAQGQSSSATLTGTVEDENGAVIPGAAITVLNPSTALQRQATTNDQGSFTVTLLQPGTYSVTVRREGFAPIEVKNVVLNVGDQKSLQIQLKTGDVKAEVQVTNEASLINESPAVGTVVDRQFVENIPLNGRSFQALIGLTPGVVTVPAPNGLGSGQFSTNGQRASANSFMVDGVSANFGAADTSGFSNTTGNLPGLTTFGTTQSLVSVDALQEFKVQTSTYAAEYGRQPGAQVSIITRSGTNQFHGSLFDYLRNDVFDANDWFANRAGQPKAKERQNDFGGTFSGPVLLPRFGEGGHQPGYNGRNRTFFFFSYEGLRLRLPQFSLTNVPTLCLRGKGSCLPGQSTAPAGMQPLLNAFPLPNGKDLGNGLAEFNSGYSDPSSLDAASIRIDHIVNSKLTLFVRYNKAPSESTVRSASFALNNLTTNRLVTQTITASATVSLTPKAINELRVNYSGNGAYQTVATDSFGGATPLPRSALIPSQYDSGPVFGGFGLNLVGITSAVRPGIFVKENQETSQHQLNVVDSFSYSTGSHQIKVGVDYRRMTPIVAVNTYNLLATFSSQQQLLAATAGNVLVNANVIRRPVILNFSAYAQDTWRLSRRLTLDVGLRWDVNPAPSEADGKDAPAVTEINNLATMRLATPGTKEWKTTYRNFAPRLGVAYQASQAAGRETMVRGGFGLFYDTGNDRGAANFPSFPYASSRTISNVPFPLSPTQVAPAPLPIQTGITPPYPFFNAFDPHLSLPYTLQWNFALQQSLGKSQAATLSYVGAAGRRLLQATRLSLSTINPNFTVINVFRNSATSDYDALQAQFQRRLSHGLQALVSYTWSHALDEDSRGDTFRAAQRGNADFDVRHVFAAAATYDIPQWRHDPLARAVLGGWSIDTSVHAQSGLPVDLVASTMIDPATGATVNVRPNVNPGVPFYLDDPTVPGGRKINSAAFTLPAAGQSGNFGRNQVRGLGSWQIDSALRRQFKLTEKVNLQFRAEAFNLFNHPNFGTIQTSLTAANFGQTISMLNRQLGGISQLYQIGGPRSFQFALKLHF